VVSGELLGVFSKVKLSVSDEDYLLVALRPEQRSLLGEHFSTLESFSSIILEADELTLAVSEKDWANLSSSLTAHGCQGPFKLVGFGLDLELETVGFLAEVTRVLAEERISILALSSYRRDYLLVKAAEAEHTVEVLGAFIDRCKDVLAHVSEECSKSCTGRSKA